MEVFARSVRSLILWACIAIAAACSPPARTPLDATFGHDTPISAEALGAQLAARAGRGAARDVAYLVAGAIITRCDEEPRDGLLSTGNERACLDVQRLDDAWSAGVSTVLATPKAMASPGWLLIIILVVAVLFGCPWAVDRFVRVVGWRLQRFTRGAWYRLWPPVRWLAALIASAFVLFVVLRAMLWFGVDSWAIWPSQWRQYYAIARWPVRVVTVLVVVCAAVTTYGLGDRARRLRGLLETASTGQRPAVQPAAAFDIPPRPEPKNILICCDGTGNQAQAIEDGRRAVSNVRKLFEVALSATESQWKQELWYDDGVGTGTSKESRRLSMLEKGAAWVSANTPARIVGSLSKLRMILELGFGIGITENIAQAYAQIVRAYQPGDRIFIVGFSRGAYTARCVAAVIQRIGLLRSEHLRFAPDVVQLYRYRNDPELEVPIHRHLVHAGARVEFLGVWDTVGSLGVPLWGWSFSIGKLFSNLGFAASSLTICNYIRHALSMDEQRSQFFPTLFDPALLNEELHGRKRLAQRWFRGSHAGVGGGYADTSLSDIALQWMVDEACLSGLLVHPNWSAAVLTSTNQAFAPNPLGNVISQIERQKAWRLSGTWPRWHPCDTTVDAGFGVIDATVQARSAHARSLRAADAPVRSDELLKLEPGGPPATVVVRGDLAWNRGGVVFERGATYRLTYLGGLWQDKEAPPCGASGQRPTGADLRRFLGAGRRKTDAQWMELIGHVAHPRPWSQREHYGRELIKYLLLQDPEELTQSLIPLGRHLATTDQAVDVEMQAPDGVFWAFANDWWLFYDNNSGEVAISIQRLPDDHRPDRPRYVVSGPEGRVYAVTPPAASPH